VAFPRSSALAARLVILTEATSTNDELAARVARDPVADWPEFSVIVTDNQTSGRGRLGRTWSAPPGTMLATSVLLRPTAAGIHDADALGWIPLIAGLAMVRAVRELGVDAELKWPNDVLVHGRKLSGVLCEAATGTVIVGAGINLTLTAEQLPVPTATSLAIEGADADADAVLAGYLSRLRDLYGSFAVAGGDAGASGVRDAVSAACATLGRSVRVERPAGEPLAGEAVALDGSGRLVVHADGRHTAVSAGDVIHLR
jgi:BirA family biotin operon repressor/biotin-[acetyl-CoA-carboxylase] ligase